MDHQQYRTEGQQDRSLFGKLPFGHHSHSSGNSQQSMYNGFQSGYGGQPGYAPQPNFGNRPTGQYGQPRPQLHILAATFADMEVTTRVQTLVTAEQTLSLDTFRAKDYFGDPWANVRKSICILYQYEGSNIELVVAPETAGMIRIDAHHPTNEGRIPIWPGNGTGVLAVVWGTQGLAPNWQKAAIERQEDFVCGSAWFGFDGWANNQKTCAIFTGDGKRIRVITARENQMCRFPKY